MIANKEGSTLVETIIAITVLLVYVVSISALTRNISNSQKFNKDFLEMNIALNNSAEELVNTKYDLVPLGQTNTLLSGGMNQIVNVSEIEPGLKLIDIDITRNSQTVSTAVYKGVDLN